MKAQTPAQPVVGVDHGQQSVELADGGAGAFAPELEHTANSFIRLVRQDGRHGTLVEARQLMSVPLDIRLDAGDLVDGGDLTVGEVGDFGIELAAFVTRQVACRHGEGDVRAEAARIDDGVELPVLLLRRRHRRQRVEQHALDDHVSLAVSGEPLAGFWGVVPTDFTGSVAFALGQRPRHFPHQLVTLRVLLDCEAKCCGGRVQPAGQCVGQGQRHAAALLRDWNLRPAVAWREDACRDRTFERVIVSDDQPVWIGGGRDEGRRDRLPRCPDFRLGVIDGKADAQDFRRRIGGIAPCAGGLERERRACFDVPEDDWHGTPARLLVAV